MSYGYQAASRIENKTALITGASSGIGLSTAYELVAASAGNLKLVLAARRLDRLEETKTELESKYPGVKVYPLKLDVSDHKSIPAAVKSIPAEFADVDILINNA